MKTQEIAPKKVLFIHHGAGIGGACMSLLYLVQSLDKKKFVATVVFMQNSAAVDLFKNARIKIIGPLNKSDFSHTKIWWYRWYHIRHWIKAVLHSLQLIFGLAKKILLEEKPDMVHLNTSSLWAWAPAAKKLKIPVLWHIREPLSDGYFGLRKTFTRYAVARWADKILPICHDNALPWKDNPKVQVLYNAVPEDRFAPRTQQKKDSTPTILFLGGLSQEKGTLWLLETFALVLQKLPHAKLLIAGTWEHKPAYFDGQLALTPWQHYCRAVAQQLAKLGNSAQLMGVTTDVPNLLHNADLLVFPATVGHFARPVIEAGFMGKPVVASNLPPMPELVKNNITGILVPPNDRQAFANAILKMLINSRLAQKLGMNAQIFCQEHFGLKRQQKSFDAILIGCLKT